jgi:nitrogen fixation NifU-like protein
MSDVRSNDELQDLYRELILDHARTPRNFGKPDKPTHTATGINPLCGDKLHVYLTVDANQIVTQTSFEGSGCAISMASASLLTETVINLSVADAERCVSAVTDRLSLDPPPEQVDDAFDLSKLRALDGVRDHPSRIKCATLAWHALHAALAHSRHPATTE